MYILHNYSCRLLRELLRSQLNVALYENIVKYLKNSNVYVLQYPADYPPAHYPAPATPYYNSPHPAYEHSPQEYTTASLPSYPSPAATALGPRQRRASLPLQRSESTR